MVITAFVSLPPPLSLHACSESVGGGHEEVLTLFGRRGVVILIVFTYQV